MAADIIEKYSNKENPFGCEIFATIDLSVFCFHRQLDLFYCKYIVSGGRVTGEIQRRIVTFGSNCIFCHNFLSEYTSSPRVSSSYTTMVLVGLIL
jgi:hypothetical protein